MNPITAIQAGAGSAASQAAAATTAAQPVTQPGTDYSPAYTVEISEEGSQLNAAAGSQTNQAGETAGTDEDSGTTNLAIYTNEQLRQMLANGEITQSQYALEITRREAEKQAETMAAGQQPVNNIAE